MTWERTTEKPLHLNTSMVVLLRKVANGHHLDQTGLGHIPELLLIKAMGLVVSDHEGFRLTPFGMQVFLANG